MFIKCAKKSRNMHASMHWKIEEYALKTEICFFKWKQGKYAFSKPKQGEYALSIEKGEIFFFEGKHAFSSENRGDLLLQAETCVWNLFEVFWLLSRLSSSLKKITKFRTALSEFSEVVMTSLQRRVCTMILFKGACRTRGTSICPFESCFHVTETGVSTIKTR